VETGVTIGNLKFVIWNLNGQNNVVREKPLRGVMNLPALCRFWREDGVWNASAVDLPIAVFGDTIEEAQSNMSDALTAHLNALNRLGL
jgi:predicted RNase H-like HicB family nuclease